MEQQAGIQKSKESRAEEYTIDPAVQGRVSKKPHRVHVARYTFKGRRRSDLELIILKAIAIIKLMRDRYAVKNKPVVDNPIYQPSTWKLQQMQDTLRVIQNMGLQDLKDLDKKLSETGAKLSQVKAEIKSGRETFGPERRIVDRIVEAEDLIKKVEGMGFHVNDLCVYTYDKESIRRESAALTPMTSAQRRQLFIELEKNPGFKVAVKYDEIPYRQAQRAINFLKGKTADRPGILTAAGDMARIQKKYDWIYDSRVSGMKEKYSGMLATPAQKKKLEEIINSEDEHIRERLSVYFGRSIDTEKISRFDAAQIISYATGTNELKTPVVDEKTAEALRALCKKNNMPLGRDVITEKDVQDVTRFLQNGKKGRVPDILDTQKPNDSTIRGIKEMLKLRNEIVTVEPENMTKADATALYTYLLNIGHEPECLKWQPEEERFHLDSKFDIFVSALTDGEAEIVESCRDILNELAKYGINPENMDSSKLELSERIDAHESNVQKEAQLKEEYKTLSRIKYNIALSQNRHFSHGPLFEERVEAVEVETQQELPEEDRKSQEEQEIEEEKLHDGKKDFRERDRFFDVFAPDLS